MLLAAARRSCSRALALPGTETSAGALFVVAVRRPRQRWRRWSWCPVPCAGDRLQRGFRVLGGNSTVFQRFPVRTAGRCRASRLRGPVRALVAAPGWRGGAPPLAVSPAPGDRSSRPATPATTPRSLPHKEKHPGSPGRPVGGVARAAPGVAGGGRGGPSEAAVFAGTDASAAPPLLPVPVCRPHVYRAKLNTTAFSAGN